MIEKENLPIIAVVASRDDKFTCLNNSATIKTILQYKKVSDCKIKLFSSNRLGLSEVYNKSIDEFLEEDVILVFVHDDVIINDYFWARIVRQGLKTFDVVGIVGNTRRIEKQAGWIMLDLTGKCDSFDNLSGSIGQGKAFPPTKLDVFGEPYKQCKLLDGVFLATTTTILRQTKLRFDGQFKFHFYDIDFCRTAEEYNLTMGTIPLSVVHQSYGSVNNEFYKSYELYLKKWNI